jgi:hypothetical protein
MLNRRKMLPIMEQLTTANLMFNGRAVVLPRPGMTLPRSYNLWVNCGMHNERKTSTMGKLAILLIAGLALPVLALGQQPATSPSTAPASGAPSAKAATGQENTLATIASQDPNTKKAKDLLQKMIAAMGGQAFLNYQTMTQEGRAYTFYQGQPNSLGIVFWRFWKYPDKDRIELTKERDVAYVYNGDNGYEITYKGTAAMEPKELSDYLLHRKYSIEQVLRVWLPDPGTLVLYDGSALADQQFVEQVTLVNKKDQSVTLGIDPNSNLLIKKTFTYRDYDGLKSTDAEVYANYRAEDGIQTPHTVVRYHNDQQTGQRFITKVSYNVPIPDSKFEARITYDMNKLKKK